jgi:carbamate kinase
MLRNRPLGTLLTQIEVDPDDPAFLSPTKFVGPVYNEKDAAVLSSVRGWNIGKGGAFFRLAVPSPLPKRILEIDVIRLLLDQGVIVICAGGGGIPVVHRDDGTTIGIETVIDKDHASGLLVRELGADAFLMLTDVDGVFQNWGAPDQSLIAKTTPQDLQLRWFPSGSMGPKVQAACEFVTATGGFAGISALGATAEMVTGTAGTRISAGQ